MPVVIDLPGYPWDISVLWIWLIFYDLKTIDGIDAFGLKSLTAKLLPLWNRFNSYEHWERGPK